MLLQNISYVHPDKDVLFENIHISITKGQKVALIGNNGAGKSTLLKIMAGVLPPSTGQVTAEAGSYYVPQIYGQFNQLCVAAALGVQYKLQALEAITKGEVGEQYFTALGDDWTIEERCTDALRSWGLQIIDLSMSMSLLSGGQKTKVFLAGIAIHQPAIILLDEPSNHLDRAGRQQLYELIRNSKSTIIMVSHDRQLLELPDEVFELSKRGIHAYGGNYEFYLEQKKIESLAFEQELKSQEKALRKAREKERETIERQQRLDARGKSKQEKAGLPTIMMNTKRNSAEKSTSKLKSVHDEKIAGISNDLNELRVEMPDKDKMRFGFDDSSLHKGKVLIDARKINITYADQPLWKEPLDLTILSGERIALKGLNGSGKTTLIKMVMGLLEPTSGTLYRAPFRSVYVDQEYSLIDNELSVYEQANQFNDSGMQEHEVKIMLARFLFTKSYWDKPCSTLSGGEKMRLMLCCLTLAGKAPDMIILDEPTNNLDIQNIEILTHAIIGYKGTLLIVSHDHYFLEETGVSRTVTVTQG